MLVGLGAFFLPEFSLGADRASNKPNFIVIFIDDQGYQDLGCFGSPNIKTPNIDRMAREGLRFTDFYSAASVCTPSRAALLTGCYPERVGNLPVLFPNQRRGLNPQETTIAEMLKGHGYKTACIGKWHLGHLTAFLPTSQGFDSYFGIPYSNDMWLDPNMTLAKEVVLREGVTINDYKKKRTNSVPLMRNTEVIEYPADQAHLTQRYTREALAFIEANEANPFFLYLPHTMPHVPLYASPEFAGQSDAGLYGDCIQEIDWSVGQILATLKRLGIDKNTLVVYTSDNGPWNFPNNAKNKVKGNTQRRVGGSALPLRGYKFQRWEGGMREPTVMWWPGSIPAGQECHEIAGTIDLLPTFASLSGAPLPDKTIDGKSLVALLKDPANTPSPHDAYFYRTKGVRSGQWKLIDGKLYDLSSDIAETTDLTREHPDILARLQKLLADRNQEINQNKRPAGVQ
jgi:arylsulfatase A-like enzyme